MPAISKEQYLALIYGVLSTSANQGASPTTPRQRFTPINRNSIIEGRENLAAVANLSTANNQIIIAGLLPQNIKVGMAVNKVTGTGALNATQGFIGAIVSVDSSNATAGILVNTRLTVVDANGSALNHATNGDLTAFVVGGIDYTNNQVPGLGNPTRLVYTLTNGRDAGDMNNNGSVTAVERDYHLTGIGLRKKLK